MKNIRHVSRSKVLLQQLSLGIGAALLAMSVQAQTINLSYNGVPDAQKNAVHLFASNLKKLVEQRTEGALELKLYPNSMLGEEQERMEQVINTPSLNIASFGGVSPILPEVFVSAIPFMFDGFDSARHFFDQGEYWQAARKAFHERTGSHILAVVEEGGFLAFTNSQREIKAPKDFEGLRFRAMDKSQVALYESFGASGTPIPWTEVYMALRTHVADGQMNPPMYIILGSLHEVQRYMTLANIQYSDQFLVANGSLLEGLSTAQRQILEEAVLEANKMNRESVQAQVETRIQFLVDHGVQVYRPTPQELAQFQKIGQPAYLQWLRDQSIAESWIETALKDVGLN